MSTSLPPPENGSDTALPARPDGLNPEIHRQHQPSIVAIGGGTGLAALLRGLKRRVRHRHQLTAIVTVADDGGSSGRLRRDFGVLPPGDIRNCIAALADDEDLLVRLFQYRFANGEGLSGHSFGNLFLTALTGITGDFYQAVLTAESILSVRGQILPATLSDVRLRGVGASGKTYEGESAIGSSGESMASMEIRPAEVDPFPPAVQAIENADIVLLGPGSLNTSIVPNLLIPGIRDVLTEIRSKVVLILNLMTQPGETDGLGAADHIASLEAHVGPLVGTVLVNSSKPSPELLELYRRERSEWVCPTELETGRAVGSPAKGGTEPEIVSADLLLEDGFIRHDPIKLTDAIFDIVEGWSERA